MIRAGLEPGIFGSQGKRPNHWATLPPHCLRLVEEKDMDMDDEHEVMLATSPLENALSMVVTPPTPATDMEQQGQGFDISFIPFRHRTSQRYGITRDTFRLRWTSPNELHDALEPEEFARQLLNALFEGVQRHIQQFDPMTFYKCTWHPIGSSTITPVIVSVYGTGWPVQHLQRGY